MKVFFDTNVYVAEAILGGAAEQMVRATLDARWRIYFSQQVLDETGRVLGHVIFSGVIIASPHGPVNGMGLGELAVVAEHQRRGIGKRLVHAGLDELRARHCPFCVVVGHASYYPRFGFERGSLHGLRCQWEKVPDASFMVCILEQRAMQGVSGVARYIDVG